MKAILLPLALVCIAAPAFAQSPAADNPEMSEIYAADQAARNGGAVDPQELMRTDTERRRHVRELFVQGVLTTARDFQAAAFVFQHGGVPEDYLLAHVLAVRAVALGLQDAEWIAAATLDRYLQATGKSQVYGTQYKFAPETGTTMEPYDRALLTDAVRVAAGTHTLAEQETRLGEMDQRLRALVAPQPTP